jgi:hypothetical protein
MYDGSEYLQNILLNKSKNNNIIKIIACIFVMACRENFTIHNPKKKHFKV